MIVTAGKTNVSAYFYIVQDASGTSPGEPATGLLFSDIETGGSASYMRQGAARTDLELVTLASASAAHTDGGFILVDDTNMPGVYRCDFPDAAFVSGVDEVSLQLVVAAAKNATASPIKVQLMAVDFRDSVRMGMTALPNVAAGAADGVLLNSLDAVDAILVATDVGQEIADRVLARNIAGSSDGGRTVTSALRSLRNRIAVSDSSLIIYEEDDVTIAWHGSLTTTSDHNFITQVDP